MTAPTPASDGPGGEGWQPGDPVYGDERGTDRRHCGPCMVAWTADVHECPECGQWSTEALREEVVRLTLLATQPPAPRSDGAALDEYALTPEPSWTPTSHPETLARRFHDAYERLAPSFGYETREASAKPWHQVPENNRRLMIAVCREIAVRSDTASVLAELRESIGATEINRDPDEDSERQIGFDDGQEWMLRRVVRLVEAAQQRLTGPGEVEQ